MSQFETITPYLQPSFEIDTDYYRQCYRFHPVHQIHLLYYEFKIKENTPNTLAAVPDGCLDIIFCCDLISPNVLVYGSVLLSKLIPFTTGVIYFGIRIPPGFGVHANKAKTKEFVEHEIDLSEFISGAKSILEQITMCNSFFQRINLFESTVGNYIVSNTENHQLTDYLIHQITSHNGNLTIKQLSNDTGYSSRYLRDKFVDNIGISPKQFSKIVRFQKSLHMLKSDYPLKDVVFQNGYYDQAHLINEFRNFGYLSPIEFMTYMKRMVGK